MALLTTRLDDQTYNLFLRDLEYREARALQVEYPELKAATGKLFPIETIDAPWAETTRYTIQDIVGDEFELASDSSTNYSLVGITGKEVIQRTYQFRKGYEIDNREILRFSAPKVNIPIEDNKIKALNHLYQQTLHKLVLYGNDLVGMPGWLNHPAFLRMAAPYPLDTTSSTSQLIATLSAGGEAMWAATKETYLPNTLLLPPRKFKYLTEQTRLDNSSTDTTVLQFFLRNNMSVRNIDWLSELEGAGPNGEDMAIFYTRNPDHVKCQITDPMRMLPYVRKEFSVVRPSSFNYGGIVAYRPFTVLLMIGV